MLAVAARSVALQNGLQPLLAAGAATAGGGHPGDLRFQSMTRGHALQRWLVERVEDLIGDDLGVRANGDVGVSFKHHLLPPVSSQNERLASPAFGSPSRTASLLPGSRLPAFLPH